jgi:hypothetical protein
MAQLTLNALNKFDTNLNGNAAALTTVTVRLAGTLTLASLFSNKEMTTPMPNPFNTDVDGFANTYLATGNYDVVATLLGFTKTIPVSVSDPVAPSVDTTFPVGAVSKFTSSPSSKWIEYNCANLDINDYADLYSEVTAPLITDSVNVGSIDFPLPPENGGNTELRLGKNAFRTSTGYILSLTNSSYANRTYFTPDLVTFTLTTGLSNPISIFGRKQSIVQLGTGRVLVIAQSSGTAASFYYSDNGGESFTSGGTPIPSATLFAASTHLLATENRFYCFYTNGTISASTICYRSSSDGVTWTAEESLNKPYQYNSNSMTDQVISAMVIKNDIDYTDNNDCDMIVVQTARAIHTYVERQDFQAFNNLIFLRSYDINAGSQDFSPLNNGVFDFDSYHNCFVLSRSTSTATGEQANQIIFIDFETGVVETYVIELSTSTGTSLTQVVWLGGNSYVLNTHISTGDTGLIYFKLNNGVLQRNTGFDFILSSANQYIQKINGSPTVELILSATVATERAGLIIAKYVKDVGSTGTFATPAIRARQFGKVREYLKVEE